MGDQPVPLSPSLGRDTLVLLPRDPDWAVAYWELTAPTIFGAMAQLNDLGIGARLVLRLYTLPDERARPHRRSDLLEYAVTEWLGNRLVLLGPPGSLHQAAIGLCDADGTFVPLCRSRVARSPRTVPGPEKPASFVRVGPPAASGEPPSCERVEPPGDSPPGAKTDSPEPTRGGTP